jgi:hypothetical protein
MSPLFALLILLLITFGVGHLLLRFAKSIGATVSDTKMGKTVHLQTPIGTFDLKPQDGLDPSLAGMLVFPGAAHVESQPPEYQADIRLLGREYHMFSATYWTVSPVDVVWDFYKRELPDWQEEMGTNARGFVQRTPECTRKIQVFSRDGRTLIETGVSMNRSAAAGADASSASGYGVLR